MSERWPTHTGLQFVALIIAHSTLMVRMAAVPFAYCGRETCTKSYTVFVCLHRSIVITMIYGSLAPLKIPFRKECRFDPDHPHHRPP